MTNYLIDFDSNKDNIVIKNEEPVMIKNMKFCYLSINKDTKELYTFFAAHVVENNALIILTQKLLLTEEEFDKSHFKMSTFTEISSNKYYYNISGNYYLEACSYFMMDREILTTDFITQEGKSDIIYAVANDNREDGKTNVYKLKIDRFMLMGVYIIYRSLNNLDIHRDVYLFANNWLAGNFYVQKIIKNSSAPKIVTGFALINTTKPIKDNGDYKGIMVYKFNTISTYDDEFNADFVVLLSYNICHRIRMKTKRSMIDFDALDNLYASIAYKTNSIAAQSIDLETFYLFCFNKANTNMIVLQFTREKFEEFQEFITENIPE